MTFPTVIETPLRMEPVTRDPFGDVSPAGPADQTAAPTSQLVRSGPSAGAYAANH